MAKLDGIGTSQGTVSSSNDYQRLIIRQVCRGGMHGAGAASTNLNRGKDAAYRAMPSVNRG
jgi:hypothetical protein